MLHKCLVLLPSMEIFFHASVRYIINRVMTLLLDSIDLAGHYSSAPSASPPSSSARLRFLHQPDDDDSMVVIANDDGDGDIDEDGHWLEKYLDVVLFLWLPSEPVQDL